MRMKRPLDDRGQPVTLRDLDKRTKRESVRLAGADRAGVRGYTWREIRRQVVLGLAGGLTLVLAVALIPMSDLMYVVVVGGVIGIVSVLEVRRRAVHRLGDRRSLALRDQRCPACWYDLAESPIEPGGCVVFPECGAAWRVPEHND
ncbi:MAG: hypothetical protein ACI89L_002568 [Phycisphaerales bacterium]|jgi:hypothetical protein